MLSIFGKSHDEEQSLGKINFFLLHWLLVIIIIDIDEATTGGSDRLVTARNAEAWWPVFCKRVRAVIEEQKRQCLRSISDSL